MSREHAEKCSFKTRNSTAQELCGLMVRVEGSVPDTAEQG